MSEIKGMDAEKKNKRAILYKWTDEELEAQMKDSRKRKRLAARVPDAVASHREMIDLTRKRTGYQKEAVKEILEAYFQVAEEEMLKKKTVKLGKFITVFLSPRKARIGLRMNGGKDNTKMIVPPMMRLQMLTQSQLRDKIKGVEVMEEDVEHIFL